MKRDKYTLDPDQPPITQAWWDDEEEQDWSDFEFEREREEKNERPIPSFRPPPARNEKRNNKNLDKNAI